MWTKPLPLGAAQIPLYTGLFVAFGLLERARQSRVEVLALPLVHADQPSLLGRSQTWVVEAAAIAQRLHVHPIQVESRAELTSVPDAAVTGDDHVDTDGLEQVQGGEVIRDGVSGAAEVQHRDEQVREHVAGYEHTTVLDQQRRVTRRVRLVLDDLDARAVPREHVRVGRQAGDQPEQVQGHLVGDVVWEGGRDAGCSAGVRQPGAGCGGTPVRAEARWCAKLRVPEQVVPVRVGGEAGHDGLAELPKVACEAGQLVSGYPRVDEEHTAGALHDDGVGLEERALVNEHTVSHLRQHSNSPVRAGSVRHSIEVVTTSAQTYTLGGDGPYAGAIVYGSLGAVALVLVTRSAVRARRERRLTDLLTGVGEGLVGFGGICAMGAVLALPLAVVTGIFGLLFLGLSLLASVLGAGAGLVGLLLQLGRPRLRNLVAGLLTVTLNGGMYAAVYLNTR